MACLLFGKDASAKPFRNDDFVLVRAVLPHISHGLDVAAMQSDYDPCGLDESEPFASSELGVVLVDQSGKVRAVNNRASGIFAQIGVSRDCRSMCRPHLRLKRVLHSSPRRFAQYFFERKGDSPVSDTPATTVWSHRSGITIKLRGFCSSGPGNASFNTILVEEGEPRGLFKRRLAVKYGMSRREVEVLTLMRNRLRRKEIARLLSISINTVKTHLREITSKLEDAGQSLEPLIRPPSSRLP